MAIVTDWDDITTAEVKKDTQVRYQGGVKSPILTELKKKDEVTIVESEQNWKRYEPKMDLSGMSKTAL